ESLEGLRIRVRHDAVLDLLDRVPQAITERKVAVDHVVDERPEQVIGSATQDRGETGPQRVDRARIPRRIVDGQQEALAEDDVDLGWLVAGRLEGKDHDVDQVVGYLDLR